MIYRPQDGTENATESSPVTPIDSKTQVKVSRQKLQHQHSVLRENVRVQVARSCFRKTNACFVERKKSKLIRRISFLQKSSLNGNIKNQVGRKLKEWRKTFKMKDTVHYIVKSLVLIKLLQRHAFMSDANLTFTQVI